jgi:hypothetical protein
MNNFENVCPDCPLRCKVDVSRAGQTGAWGSDGSRKVLFDGDNRKTVTLNGGSIYDSDTAYAIEAQNQNAIEACERPTTGWLRKKCAAGLGSTWRWAERTDRKLPNVHSPADIAPLLADADYLDAMPYSKEDYILLGDPEEFSELELDYQSSFSNMGIKKLKKTISGTTAKLHKRQAVMLDAAYGTFDGIYRIRIAQGGPYFAFRTESPLPTDEAFNIDDILSEGIFRFLHSAPEDIQASNDLLVKIAQHDYDRQQNLREYIESGALTEALKNVQLPEGDPEE